MRSEYFGLGILFIAIAIILAVVSFTEPTEPSPEKSITVSGYFMDHGQPVPIHLKVNN